MRAIKSRPGMSREDAMRTLQRVARANDEVVVDFYPQANRWHAKLEKAAEFPPEKKKDEDEDEGAPMPPADDSADDAGDSEDGSGSDDSEGSDPGAKGDSPVPGSDKQGPEGEKGEEKGELRELLSLIHQIADKMGIVPAGHGDKMGDGGPMPPAPPAPGGPDGPPMGGPDGGPDGGPPAGGGKAPPMPSKIKPGEVLPHQTPVGAPAFASTRQATLPGAQAVPADPSAPAAEAANVPCSKCGGPTVGGVCPNCTSAAGGQMGQPMMAAVNDPHQVLGKKRTIATKVDTPMSAAEAYRQATAAFQPHGYSVQQLVPQADGTWTAILQG